MKDRTIIFVRRIGKRVEAVNEVFADLVFFSVSAMLDVSTALVIEPLQPLSGLYTGFSVGLITMTRNDSNFFLL